MSDAFHVALAGNPNCGKTTLFNALTGSRYKVANYPGVTVEKREGFTTLPGDWKGAILDLPGTYSLFGSAPDEAVATSIILGENKREKQLDGLIVAVDASNLERNLYLVTQLIDFQIPTVIVLTMSDLAEKQGVSVYNELLSRELDLPVVTVNGGKELEGLKIALETLLRRGRRSTKVLEWLPKESAVRQLAPSLGQRATDSEKPVVQGANLVKGIALLGDSLPAVDSAHAKAINTAREELRLAGVDALSFEATQRYRWVQAIASKASAQNEAGRSGISKKIDHFLTHPVSGTLALLGIMLVMFQSIFLWAAAPMELISNSVDLIGNSVGSLLPHGALRSLIVEGIIAGVGNVIIFIPQIAILFLFLGILEDSGYLSRAAYLLDNFMRRFGLQGRAFIPLLSSFACAIPGILATRTIPSRADRLATVMIAPLMSCSARLPVYAVLISAFIPKQTVWGVFSLQGLTLLVMYFLGIITAALIGLALRHSLLRRQPAFLVMEMPLFRRPNLRVVLRTVWDRVVSFIRAAGSIILACSIVLWFLASYPKPPSEYRGNPVQFSYAGRVGTFMEPLIRPLGYNWEIGVGLLGSFAAREVFISSLAMVYSLADEEDSSLALENTLKTKRADGTFTLPTALSLLVFYVYACMCMSTLAVCKRETGSWGWTTLMFGYMTALAYIGALITYQVAIRVLV